MKMIYLNWQAALQATTRYVWFLDDDVLPGPNALALLLHVSNTQQYKAMFDDDNSNNNGNNSNNDSDHTNNNCGNSSNSSLL